jgi:hypothetical protein
VIPESPAPCQDVQNEHLDTYRDYTVDIEDKWALDIPKEEN